MDDATWQAEVVPAIARLRALPEPDRRRERLLAFRLGVYGR
jgi:hypothetical protein